MTQSAAPARRRSGSPAMLEKEVTIYIGGVHATDQPEVVKTLLGSCISVCLYDPITQVGGMNHFMLPRGSARRHQGDLTRFGVHAMDYLIGQMMKLGGDRRRFVAKCFGGGHVLDMQESVAGVPQQNIAFIRSFLRGRRLPDARRGHGRLPASPRPLLHRHRAGASQAGGACPVALARSSSASRRAR